MTAGVTQRSVRPALHVAVVDGVDTIAWSDLHQTGNGLLFSRQHSVAEMVIHRMRQSDLGGALKERVTVREEWICAGKDPADLIVALEIDVLIATDAPTARMALRLDGGAQTGDTVRYVGTPHGLATLVLDAYAAHVADAAILRPITSIAGSGGDTAALIIGEVLPLLGGQYLGSS